MAGGGGYIEPSMRANQAQPASLFSPFSPNIYSSAVKTQAGDYDSLMGNYKSLLSSQQSTPVPKLQYQPLTPQTANYQRSGELDSALNASKELSETGGYSDDALAALRARGVSPIRAIYANAQMNLKRQKSLMGGYSPNYTAASVKLSRDLSEKLGEANTNVEASIADRVAQGKQQGLSAFSNLAARDSDNANQFAQQNANLINQINQMNMENQQRVETGNQNMNQNAVQQMLATIEGMRGLYGTTPALSSLYGSQQIQGQQLEQNQGQFEQAQREREQAQLNQIGAGLLSSYSRPYYG